MLSYMIVASIAASVGFVLGAMLQMAKVASLYDQLGAAREEIETLKTAAAAPRAREREIA